MFADEKITTQKEFFFNRLAKNYRRLKKWARKNNVESYRVFDRDIPEIPLTVDIYNIAADSVCGNYAMVFLYERPYQKDAAEEAFWLGEMLDAASSCLGIERACCIAAVRKRQRGSNQYGKDSRDAKAVRGIIAEGEARFYVTLGAYIDTGFFLDHRKLRRMIFEQARGKRVLNLFCYTCAFSVAAALGGAAAVDSVDISNTYLEEGRRNFALNGIALDDDEKTPRRRAAFIRSDVEDFLLNAARKKQLWDIIILDPPTFSNSKKTHNTLDINRDWARLVNLCLDSLASGGALYFSTNSRRFKFDASLIHSANTRGCAVRFEETTPQTISEDFARKAPHRSWRFTVENGAGSAGQ